MSKKEKEKIIIESQYQHYSEMIRFYLNLSWQIPTLAIVAVVGFIGLETDKIKDWKDYPLPAFIAFFILGLFFLMLYLHNKRNLTFATSYEKALTKLEKKYGYEITVHHFQTASNLKGVNKISSSKMLSRLLSFMTLIFLSVSFYYLYIFITNII